MANFWTSSRVNCGTRDMVSYRHVWETIDPWEAKKRPKKQGKKPTIKGKKAAKI